MLAVWDLPPTFTLIVSHESRTAMCRDCLDALREKEEGGMPGGAIVGPNYYNILDSIQE
jgi:hypothetical protein